MIAPAQNVGRGECDVVRRHLRAAHGCFEHPGNDRGGAIDARAGAVHHQTVAVDAERDFERFFQCREILIELSEQAEVIAQGAEVYGSFGDRFQLRCSQRG
jgi:hypothetical protein